MECVPNFSEGRNQTVIRRLRDAVAAVAGVRLLGCDSDGDHNRSVITFAGPPDAVRRAALDAACLAARLIDLTRHEGVHPRIGAADVVPFVPLRGATLEDCANLARRFAEDLWRLAQVPSFLYEFAALQPERQRLESFRKLGFERIHTLIPDVGGPAPHATAGACAVGARRILIACNVVLASDHLDMAKRLARRVRESSGGFPHVKALGFRLESRGLVQVSLNLTHCAVTPLSKVYGAIASECRVAETELIGFVPQAVVDEAPEFFARCRGFNSHRVLETHLGEIERIG